MNFSNLFRNRALWAAGALVLVWAISFLSSDSRLLITSDVLDRLKEYAPSSSKKLMSISSADDSLKELCQQTQWNDGLWLSCHSSCGPNKTSICGGLNNARNRVQACLRLAINLGAGVIIPFVSARHESDLGHYDATRICPNVWWDMDYLTESMANLCPKLQVRTCQEDAGIAKVVQLPDRNYQLPPHYNDTFWTTVNSSLAEAQISLAEVSPSNPVLLRYGDSHISWSYKESGELSTIRKALFKTLLFNKTLLDLGSKIFKSEKLQGGNFIGVHLRVENDWPDYWGPKDTQMTLHVQEIVRTNSKLADPVKTVYVSCGDIVAIQQFRDMLTPLNYTVHDKWTVLEDRPEILELVTGLPFDQKGIVDYNVMVGARFWQGLLISTMSSLIAYARTMDEPDEFFSTYIYTRSLRWALDRIYADNLSIKGNEHTKLFITDGQDIMDAFP